jgi:hypothetical protein
MFPRSAAPLLLVVAALLAAPDATTAQPADDAPESHDLRPLWEDGQTARYRSITRRLTTIEITGPNLDRTQQTVLHFQTDLTWHVTDADPDGGGTARMRIDDIQARLTNAAGTEYRVTPDEAPEQLQALQTLVRAMVGAEMTVEVADDGRITGVTGWKAIQRQGGEAAAQLKEVDFIEMASELAVLVGGAADRQPGARWDADFAWDHELGTLQLETDYELESVERVAGVPLAIVAGESDVDFQVDVERASQPDGPKVDVRFEGGSQTSQIFYDLTRHEVAGRNLDRTLRFKVTLSFQGRQIEQHREARESTQVLRLAEE